MTETAAGLLAALYKALSAMGLTVTAFGIGAALASVVVMCMSMPRTVKEWTVAIISTVVGSIGGGAFVIVKFQLLEHGVTTVIHAAALFGVVFACGLPAWIGIRLLFNWIDKSGDKDILQAAREIREVI